MVPTLTALRRVDLAPRYKQGCPRCNWARTPCPLLQKERDGRHLANREN
jgi:hypothetical protein